MLAGGQGRRLGGRDKAAIAVGGRTLLDRAVEACSGADEVIVVGPHRTTRSPVRWAREEPPGSGPLAGLAAGLEATTSDPDVVMLLAVDLPSIDGDTVTRLVSELTGGTDAAVVFDGQGWAQPLVAAYRAEPLRAALRQLGDPRDRAVRAVLPLLHVTEIADDAAAADIDTPDDLTQWQTPGYEPTPTDRRGA